MMLQVGGMFSKIKLDGGSIMVVMGSTSEMIKDLGNARYQTLG
jgi:hypothetical protein